MPHTRPRAGAVCAEPALFLGEQARVSFAPPAAGRGAALEVVAVQLDEAAFYGWPYYYMDGKRIDPRRTAPCAPNDPRLGTVAPSAAVRVPLRDALGYGTAAPSEMPTVVPTELLNADSRVVLVPARCAHVQMHARCREPPKSPAEPKTRIGCASARAKPHTRIDRSAT